MIGNLLGLIRRTAATARVATQLISGYLANVLWLIESSFFALARQAYGGNPVVYACLRLLSQSVPEPPLIANTEAADGTLKPVARDHPLQQLIRHPNELLTEYRFWELVTLQLGVAGRSHWWKERNNAGQIIALWPLRPDRVGPIYSQLDDPDARVLKGWSYQVPGTTQYLPVPRQDVLTFTLPDPAGESGGLVEGLGPLQVLAAEISADNEATKLVGALVANYATPGVVITSEAPIPDGETARLIKQAFMQQFGGAHRGEPALLDGKAKVQPLSFSLQQLEFPSLRDVAESRIAAAFGVPAILVGLKVGLTSGIRATISEQREYFAETTLSNYWRRFSDQYTQDVAAEFDPALVCAFDTSKVKALAAQDSERQNRIKDGWTDGAVTLNEFRTIVLGLPALAGDRGQDTLVEMNAKVAQTITTTSERQDLHDQEARTNPSGKSAPRRLLALKTAPKLARTAMTREDGLTDAHTPALDHALDSLKDAYISRLLVAGSQKADLGDQVTDPSVPETAAALKAWEGAILAAHRASVSVGFDDVQADLELGLSFDVSNARVQDVLDELATRIGGINGTTAQAVRRAIGDGLASGESIDQLAQRLEDLPAFSKSRARLVARNESGTAYNRGAALAYRDGGVKQVYVADGTHDALCAPYDGTVQDLDWFEANPKAHVNCTRAAAPVPDGYQA